MKLLLPLLCGMAAAWEFPVPFVMFPALGAMLLAAVTVLPHGTGRTFLLYAILALLGAAKMTLDLSGSDPDAVERFVRPDAVTQLTCRITDVPRTGASTIRFAAEAESISAGSFSGKIHGAVSVVLRRDTLHPELEAQLRIGRRLAARGELALPPRARNPGEFDFREYLLIHGIACEFVQEAHSVPLMLDVDEGGPVDRCVVPVRTAVAGRINELFAPDEASFLRGLIIGDRSVLDAETRSAFINAGVMHIIAVSGLHVAVVVLMLTALMRLMRLGERSGFLLLAACLVYYVPLTGGSPSVARSVLMALVILGGKIVQRKVDIYNTLAASAVVLLLIDARQLLDPGFQLSYMAVLSLVAAFPLLKPEDGGGRIRRALKTVLAGFAVSVAASAGTFPITAYHFGRISIVGLAANVIVVPLSNAVLGLGMLAVAVSFVWGWLGSVYAAAAGLCTTALLDVVRWFGRLPLASTNVTFDGAGVAVAYACIVVALGVVSRGYRRQAILLSLIAANAAMAFWLFRTPPAPVLRVTMLDIGQGDALVLRFPDGSAVLLDAGPTTRSSDMGAAVIVPYLARSGIRRLASALVSHPHDDHLGGMPSVLRSVPVHALVDAGFGPDSRLAAAYVAACDSLRLERKMFTAGAVIPCDPLCRMYLLHPTPEIARGHPDRGSGLNNQSLVVKLVYGTTSILLSGDAEAESEERLVRVYGDFLQSDVLKAGHHGSITSSSAAYLAAVRPARVLISVGRRNRFHHPSPAVIARLKGLGCEVFRTDESGAVILESDGRSWRTVAWR